MQSDLASSDNILYIAVSGKVTTIKFMLEATFQHISYRMTVTLNQYTQYRRHITLTDMAEVKKALDSSIYLSYILVYFLSLVPTKLQYMQDVTTIKIPETVMFTDILLALGLKVAKINHTLEDNDMFRGMCKFKLPIGGISKDVGKTIILGDLKKSPSEAECSAAAQSIRYLERTLESEVVDLSLPILVVKKIVKKHLNGRKVLLHYFLHRHFLALQPHYLMHCCKPSPKLPFPSLQ
jgi:hypothetical protein